MDAFTAFKAIFILAISSCKANLTLSVYPYLAYSAASLDSSRRCSVDNAICAYKSHCSAGRIVLLVTFTQPIEFKFVVTIPALLRV